MKTGDIIRISTTERCTVFLVKDGVKIIEGLKPEDFVITDGNGEEIPNSVTDLGDNTFEIIFKKP